MTNSEAIDILKERIELSNEMLTKPFFQDAQETIKQTIEAYKVAIKALEYGWIPCSEETGEGYPEEDGFYYVTEQNYGFYLDADYKQRVTHTSHFKNGDFTDRFYTENNSNITAWMPLPEPYAERGQDE